jgi:thymidine phosphorylase
MLWAMPMLTQKVQVRCRGKGNSPPEAIRHLSQLQGSSMKEQLLPQEIIRRKRDGYSLTVEELRFMVRGMVNHTIGDGQLAAFAMAIFFRGLSLEERIALTAAMARSGKTLDWSSADLAGPVLDKHSTGGVGDKVSLILVPLAAACGAYVPMIAGRGLGHSGGTVDKLESIPSYNTTPKLSVFRQVVRKVGCAIIGQTAELAPADRRLYAIRDLTATVESIDLITASILSKKLAAGLQGLVLDVKTGSGAFLTTIEESRRLAESLVTVAQGAGLPTAALITDMNQVLGYNVGNALEVQEAVDYLRGVKRNPRLHEVVMALGSAMLVLGQLAADELQARVKLSAALDSGQAASRFAGLVAALGGPVNFLERASLALPQAPVVKAALAAEAGIVSRMDTRAIGLALIRLGGGRESSNAKIDPRVGFSQMCQIGDRLDPLQPLAQVHARSLCEADATIAVLRQAMTLAEEMPPERLVIYQRLGTGSLRRKS